MTALKKFLSTVATTTSVDRLKYVLSEILTVLNEMNEILRDHERRIKELEDEGRDSLRRHSQSN